MDESLDKRRGQDFKRGMSRDLSPINLDEALNAAQGAAQQARRVLQHYWGHLQKVSTKEKAGLVTEADVESEQVIVRHLRGWNDQIGFLGEENAFSALQKDSTSSWSSIASRKARWIIDPLDGTTNYIHQFPVYCVSIALEWEGELVLGVVDVPALDQTFHALKNKGAFCNGQSISVSQRPELKECLLATGFYGEDQGIMEHQVQIFSRFLGKTRGIRRAGAAAFDLCMVAAGVFDAFWESNLQPWDTAAGALMVREAGGRVTNYKGQYYDPEMDAILASNGLIHQSMLTHF